MIPPLNTLFFVCNEFLSEIHLSFLLLFLHLSDAID